MSLLYPERQQFHVSEYVGFASTIGSYYCLIDKPEPAEILLGTLEELAPEHTLTERLRAIILPAILKRNFEMLIGRTRKGQSKKKRTRRLEDAK